MGTLALVMGTTRSYSVQRYYSNNGRAYSCGRPTYILPQLPTNLRNHILVVRLLSLTVRN